MEGKQKEGGEKKAAGVFFVSFFGVFFVIKFLQYIYTTKYLATVDDTAGNSIPT